MRKLGRPAAALLAVVLVLLAVFHAAVLRFTLANVASLATGYALRYDSVTVGLHHAVLTGVHVSRHGEAILDAGRIDFDYSPRDLLPGSKHRFGISAVEIDGPHFTLVHHKDGTYNVAFPRAVGGAGPSVPNLVPLAVRVRIRDASATLYDAYRYYKESRLQRVDRIAIDATIDSQTVTHYLITGFLEDAHSEPFRMAGRVDNTSGYALHHVSVREIPIATISNYFINSPAARVLGGSVRDMDLQIWGFAPSPSAPLSYHMAGSGFLNGGQMTVKGLDSPIAALVGRIILFDSGFAASQLTARVGHLPIVCSGGIFNFANPQFRIGVEGAGDLRNLQEIMRIARGLPIRGALRIHALIEGGISNPVLMVGFDGRHWNYGAVPLENPHGNVALLNDRLIVLPFHASYGAMKMHVQGSLHLGKLVHSVLAVHAVGPSSAIPYLGALVPEQQVLTEALLKGDDLKVDSSGYIASIAQPQNVNGFFQLDRYGVGRFGPMHVSSRTGTLDAGFSMDRRSGDAAFWASAANVRLRQPHPIVMPGITIPEMPPIDAYISDANIAGAGSSKNVVVGGTVHMSPAQIAGVPFYRVSASFAGPFAQSHLSAVSAAGPWGTFDGNGTFGTNAIAARGHYTGTLQGLRMFLGGMPAAGGISGPMAIAISRGTIYVQADGARMTGATIHGIPISSMSGSLSFANNVLRIYSAQAQAAGGRIDLAGSFATAPQQAPTSLALVTATLDAAQLSGLGVPMHRGALRAAGTISPGAAIPDLNAGVVVNGGDLLGYGPFDTSAELRIDNGVLGIGDAIASLGSTSAEVRGTIEDLVTKSPSYDIVADVPAGSVAAAAQLARVPTHGAQGSFDGTLHIRGSGLAPHVSGRIGIPVGSINGLGFRDGFATIEAGNGTAGARDAGVTIGSTSARFSATASNNQLAFSMRAPHADLADFNDYFDTGDTLAGTGSVNLNFEHFNRLTFTSGSIDIDNLRYKSLPIGDTDAQWTGLRDLVQGKIAIGGEHGRLSASGTIDFAASPQIAKIVVGSRYNVAASLTNFDLSTWLPALGFAQLPITGRVDGTARVRGGYPHLDLSLGASMRDGTVGPLPIESASLSARSAPGDRIDLTNLAFSLPSLEASGSGSIGLRPGAPLNLELHAATNDLAVLVARVSKRHLDVTGNFESSITVRGTMHTPEVFAGVEGTGVNAFGIAIPSFVGQLQLHRRNIVLRNAEVSLARGTMTLAGSLPLQMQPFSFGPGTAAISMDAAAENVDLAAFSDFLGNATKVGGTLNGHIGISGTVNNPRIYGSLAASGASYVSNLETTPITQTIAQLSFSGERATLDRLHALLGRGTLDGRGSLSFGGIDGGPLGYSVSIVARGAQLSNPTFGSGTLEGRMALARSGASIASARGNVTIHDAVIPFGSFLQFGAPGGTGTGGGALPFNLAMNVEITAGKNVRVRGGGAGLFGLDIGAQGAVHLAGTLLNPTLDGSFASSGGTLTYIDHAFRVQTANVTFTPSNGVLPDIYAVATTHVFNPDPNTARNPSGYTDITADVTGTVPNVKVALNSSPPGYTQEQLVALLLPFSGVYGPIQFTQNGVIITQNQLPGAPAIAGGPLPDIFEQRQNGTVTIGQEAFNILNAQFAAGILAPVESTLGSALGISDVNLTFDPTGNVGVGLRRALGTNVYALYATTFSVPQRQTFGVAYQPNAYTSAQFSMFFQSGETPLFESPSQILSTNARASLGEPVQGQNGFTFLFQRLF